MADDCNIHYLFHKFYNIEISAFETIAHNKVTSMEIIPEILVQ